MAARCPYNGLLVSRYPHRFIVRPAGEVSTKSKRTRPRFQKALRHNLADALRSAGIAHRIRDTWNRLHVSAADPEAWRVMTQVFGIASVSPVAATCRPELERLFETGLELYREQVATRTFAVRARVTGAHDFGAQQLNESLGARLAEHGKVDLTTPELTVELDVREEKAFFFHRREAGPGGLPLGVEGRALVLFSGGFDSAVAAWMAMRRGVAVDYLFCHLGGPEHERSVIRVANLLARGWSYGTRPALHVVDLQQAEPALRERVERAFWQVVLKRLMLRTADRLAREIDAAAIVTGESIGQVSSQTLAVLGTHHGLVQTPLLQPVIGLDKQEIIAYSRRIGSDALSRRVQELCALATTRTVTHPSKEAVDAQEQRLDFDLDATLAGRRTLDLRSITPESLLGPQLTVDHLPAGATLIDLRLDTDRNEPLPGSLRLDPRVLEENIEALERSRPYVIFCEHGQRSRDVAAAMRERGFEAYAFEGRFAKLVTLFSG